MKHKAALVMTLYFLAVLVIGAPALAMEDSNLFVTQDDWFVECDVYLNVMHRVYDVPQLNSFSIETDSWFDREVSVTGYCYLNGEDIIETYVSPAGEPVTVASWPPKAKSLFLKIGSEDYWVENSDVKVVVFTGKEFNGFPTKKYLREILH